MEKIPSSSKQEVLDRIHAATAAIVVMYADNYTDGSPIEKIAQEFTTIIPFDEASIKQIGSQLEQTKSNEERINFLNTIADDIYQSKEKQMGEELMRQVEKFVLLSVIDNLWMDHLDAIENLRQGIGLRGYGQKDPLVEYKNEAFKMFEQLINAIDDEVVHRIYKIQVQAPPDMPQEHQHMIAQPAGAGLSAEVSQSSAPKPAPVVSDKKKLGRNDPCWCGSGKKYKKCHYPN